VPVAMMTIVMIPTYDASRLIISPPGAHMESPFTDPSLLDLWQPSLGRA
jgi:hypothetical protein